MLHESLIWHLWLYSLHVKNQFSPFLFFKKIIIIIFNLKGRNTGETKSSVFLKGNASLFRLSVLNLTVLAYSFFFFFLREKGIH